VRQRPGAVRPEPAVWRAVGKALKPLKMFRMFITVVPALAACWVIEAVTGSPAIRMFLIVGAAALALLLLFQSIYYYAYQLENEIAEQAALLKNEPTLAPTALRTDRSPAEEKLPRAASRG
jgi:hypothetical protein